MLKKIRKQSKKVEDKKGDLSVAESINRIGALNNSFYSNDDSDLNRSRDSHYSSNSIMSLDREDSDKKTKLLSGS